jgi:hypothetical protein
LPSFKGESGFRQWLSSIAVRTRYDFWRKTYRSREVPMSVLTEKHQNWLEGIEERIRTRHATSFINSITADNKPEQTLSKLKKHLNLTKEQISAVQPIIEKEHERLENIVEKYREQHHPKIRFMLREIRELREFTDKQLENFLTETQMEKYREIQREKRFVMHPKTAKHRFAPID